jgi:hypothetical protein
VGDGGLRRGRTLALGLSIVLASGATDVTRAAAHSCAEPVTVVEGVDTEVQVGVTVGEMPTEEITFEFALSIEITRDVERRGWKVEQEPSTIRFTGGPLEPDTCVLFDVPIRANDPGTFRVRAFQLVGDRLYAEHPPDGDVFVQPDGSNVVVDHSGPPDPLFEQVIYVTAADDEEASLVPLLLTVATLAAAVIGLFVLVARRSPGRSRRR